MNTGSFTTVSVFICVDLRLENVDNPRFAVGGNWFVEFYYDSGRDSTDR